MASSISTGVTPALLAIATLVTFLANKQTNGMFWCRVHRACFDPVIVCVAMGFVMDGTYSITLLWNLNSRRPSDEKTHSRHDFSAHRRSISHGDVIDMKPTVNVVRTIQVNSDASMDDARHPDYSVGGDDLFSSTYLTPNHRTTLITGLLRP